MWWCGEREIKIKLSKQKKLSRLLGDKVLTRGGAIVAHGWHYKEYQLFIFVPEN